MYHFFVPAVTKGNENTASVQAFIFLFLFLVLIKGIIGRQGEFKIPLRNSSGGQVPLRPSASYDNLLGRVVFRTLSNIYNGAFLGKQPTAIRCWLFSQKYKGKNTLMATGCRHKSWSFSWKFVLNSWSKFNFAPKYNKKKQMLTCYRFQKTLSFYRYEGNIKRPFF